MKPSVGRIVHYYEGENTIPLAAIITKVWTDDCINLVVFGHIINPGGLERTSVTNYAGSNSRWEWPPRV